MNNINLTWSNNTAFLAWVLGGFVWAFVVLASFVSSFLSGDGLMIMLSYAMNDAMVYGHFPGDFITVLLLSIFIGLLVGLLAKKGKFGREHVRNIALSVLVSFFVCTALFTVLNPNLTPLFSLYGLFASCFGFFFGSYAVVKNWSVARTAIISGVITLIFAYPVLFTFIMFFA